MTLGNEIIQNVAQQHIMVDWIALRGPWVKETIFSWLKSTKVFFKYQVKSITLQFFENILHSGANCLPRVKTAENQGNQKFRPNLASQETLTF